MNSKQPSINIVNTNTNTNVNDNIGLNYPPKQNGCPFIVLFPWLFGSTPILCWKNRDRSALFIYIWAVWYWCTNRLYLNFDGLV